MAEESGGAGELAGRTLGGYALKALLRAGPTAEVYRAEDTQLERAVAVKVLRPEVAADPARAERFREAAQRMAALDHVNVVRVLAYGEADGRLYVEMPLLRESLRERMRRKGILPVGEAARTVIQVASGLHAAHAQGIVHGDVKPENILYDDTGRALVADFGGPAAESPYLAPEQRRGDEIDARADVYALGAVLYELLAGVPPAAQLAFGDGADGEQPSVTIAPPSAHNPLVWAELDALTLAALADAPGDRTQDVRELALALRATVAVRLHMREAALGTAPVTAVGAGTGVPRASFDAPGAILPSEEEMAALYRPRRVSRPAALAAVALSLLLVLACAGSGVAVIGGLFSPGGSGYQSPNIGTLTGTATGGPSALDATPAPTDTPTPTPTPTATPSATATPTDAAQPTATAAPPAPAPTMQFGPLPLLFQSSKHTFYCVGQQSITNTSPYPVSWRWTSPTSGVAYSFSGAGNYANGTPSYGGMSPASTVTLSVRFSCPAGPRTFYVNVLYWQTSNPANSNAYSFATS